MTLNEKIKNINVPKLQMFSDGDNYTIKEFFEAFVKPRLPKEDIIREWHKLLMEYTDESNIDKISCCVRYGNVGSKTNSNQGENGYYKLRRGWLTKNTDDQFEYFFADNFFSSFIYKMALDDYCPSLDEFAEAFKNHSFPYGFGYMIDNKVNEYKGVVIKTAKEPGFLGKYKLSHVFDSGENFVINGKIYDGKCDKKLSELYYDIGHCDDFLKNSDRIRKMQISKEAKKVIIAKFLRFAHPFNYFLTPNKKLHKCGQYVYMNDIGEDSRMISYVKAYLKKTYPIEYREFIERILWYEKPNSPIEDGSSIIDIKYYNKKVNVSSKQVNPSPKKTSKRMIIFNLVKQYISTYSTASLDELDKAFPKLAVLSKNVKDTKRYFDEIIIMPNGDEIRITNQIGDKPDFPSNRNYSKLIEKFKGFGII